MKPNVYSVVAALCLCAITFAAYAPVVSPQPYGYDEADYMWAGKQGLWANYTDQNGLSFVTFIKKGLELSRDSGKRQSFSEYIRSTGDISSYRHYHGPLYAYWLALVQFTGQTHETVFRGSGLLIHFASAMLILFGFRAIFRSLPPPAALVACALFLFSRTTLTAATFITQHLVFTFFSIAFLFALSLFMRRLEPRWFYVTAALLGCAFSALETSALLAAALVVTMLIDHRRIRQAWPSWKAFGGLFARGLGCLLLAMVICWPTGILELGVAKGFLTLAYMSIKRKTFSPFGPLDLWSAKFQASPWEFSLLVAGTVVAFALWRRFSEKRELIPWLAFTAIFFLTTLKITLEFTYYYAPLAAAMAVLSGAAFGLLWSRSAFAARAALLLTVLVSVTGTTLQFREVLRESRDSKPYEASVLHFLDQHPPEPGVPFYVPFQLVPPMHYYHPEIAAVGYDAAVPTAQLLDGIESPAASETMLCEESSCAELQRQSPGVIMGKELIDANGPAGRPVYLARIRKAGGS